MQRESMIREITRLDHSLIHVSDGEQSTNFYIEVLRAEPIPFGTGFAYRFGIMHLNCHRSSQVGQPRTRVPVMPGGSDVCFGRSGTIEQVVDRRILLCHLMINPLRIRRVSH